MSRPEYIRCIADNHVQNDGKSWCGRWIKLELHFQSIDHATLNGRNEGRLVACPECAAAIIAALSNGQEE